MPQHLRILLRLVEADVEIVSRILFLTFITMTAINVYCVTKLVLVSLAPSERTQLVVLCGLHLFLAGLAFQPMVAAGRLIHYPTKQYLYQAQKFVSRKPLQHLNLKLKLLKYYKMLTSGQAFAFSVGPLCKVYTSSFLQVKIILFFVFLNNFICHLLF